MNIPGFNADISLSGYGREFRIVVPEETALTDMTIIVAGYDCGPGTKCVETGCIQEGCVRCEEMPYTLCSKNMGSRWYDPWYTRCADFKRYTDGALVQQGADYWGDNGCHHVDCNKV